VRSAFATDAAARVVVGLVTAYDPNTHSAKVMLKPDNTETGWIQANAIHIGGGWGVAIGLTPGDGMTTGDQVELMGDEGDLESLRITNRLFSDQDKPPVAQAGEIVIQHKNAGTLKFDQSQNVTWTGANGQTIVTDKNGNMTHTLVQQNNNTPKHTTQITDSHGNVLHSTTMDPTNGIAHTSSIAVAITAPKVKTIGDHEITGSLFASKTIQSAVGLIGSLIEGAPGTPAQADQS